jgi:peptidoglycan/xylan/chitin deacetylase (PgdA/CDA1 family)
MGVSGRAAAPVGSSSTQRAPSRGGSPGASPALDTEEASGLSVRRVALTFDDGPSEWTEPILDVLAANDARATFFVIGSIASERVDVLRRMVAEGHEVGNHTWSHPHLAIDCDEACVRAELTRTNRELEDLLGSAPTRFRAPHYDVDARVAAIARSLGLEHTRGDVTPPDWYAGLTAPFIATQVLQQAWDGAVIGLHDGVPPSDRGGTRQPTADAIAIIVPRLRERRFQCMTASALLGSMDGLERTDAAPAVA